MFVLCGLVVLVSLCGVLRIGFLCLLVVLWVCFFCFVLLNVCGSLFTRFGFDL